MARRIWRVRRARPWASGGRSESPGALRFGSVDGSDWAAPSVIVRPLAESDLPAVGALFHRLLGKPGLDTPEEASQFLRRTLVEDPWADEAIPSLVSTAPDGKIVGFIGSSVRRVNFDGEGMRAAYASHLVADPDYSNRTVGLFLLRAFLRGAQDLTLTDTATTRARGMWLALGGTSIHHLNVGWMRVLRPASTAVALGRRRGAGIRTAARATGAVSPLLDRLARRVAGEASAPPPGGITDELLDPVTALENLSGLSRPARLVPDYDERFLRWLFRELARGSARGLAQFRLVRARGSIVGWYVYFLEPGGLCRVLQIMCRERHSDSVIGALHRHAYAGGAAALYGRLEPHTSEAVLRRGALLRPIPRALVHTRNGAVVEALQQASSALSWIDGEPW
jgi:hypothetical protein